MRFRELLSCASALFAVAISMPIGAAAQSVGVETSVESDGSSTMVHTALIEASPKQVWHAISTAEGWTEAVLSYNRSREYLINVRDAAASYALNQPAP